MSPKGTEIPVRAGGGRSAWSGFAAPQSTPEGDIVSKPPFIPLIFERALAIQRKEVFLGGLRSEHASELGTQGASEALPLYLRRASSDLDWKLRFRIIAAKASRNNKNPLIYSESEGRIKDELVRMGFVEGESFLHQHRLFGYHGKRGQRVYYWLDLFIPSLLLDIEADGEIWHTFTDMKARDRRRDRILGRRYGIKVIRLSSYHMRKKRLNKILAGQIERRAHAVSRGHP